MTCIDSIYWFSSLNDVSIPKNGYCTCRCYLISSQWINQSYFVFLQELSQSLFVSFFYTLGFWICFGKRFQYKNIKLSCYNMTVLIIYERIIVFVIEACDWVLVIWNSSKSNCGTYCLYLERINLIKVLNYYKLPWECQKFEK